MIKIEHEVLASPEQMMFIIEGMRNPMNSWKRSDSNLYPVVERIGKVDGFERQGFMMGRNDHELMASLSAAGTDHRKFLRMMPVYIRITAPLYWWKEFDTYKVGTVSNSCSTMHKLTARDLTIEDFSTEYFDADGIALINRTIKFINKKRDEWGKEKDEVKRKQLWYQMIQALGTNFNQTRNCMLNYEVLANIYKSRKNHKQQEWRDFCKWIERLLYAELICDFETQDDTSKKSESQKENIQK